jgi:ribosome modulation factor
MKKQRPLGAYKDLAWLRGWDAGILGGKQNDNPYRRPEQRWAWEQGRICGDRSNDKDVAALKARLAKRKEAGLPTY